MIAIYSPKIEVKDGTTILHMHEDYLSPIYGLTPEQAVDVKRAMEMAYRAGVRAGLFECQQAVNDIQQKLPR